MGKGEIDRPVPGRPEPAEEAGLLVDHLEQPFRPADRFGRAEEQRPAVAQPEVE